MVRKKIVQDEQAAPASPTPEAMVVASKPDPKSAKTAFSCYSYPELRVLIHRGDGSIGGDTFAEFHHGFLETDDPATIAILRQTPGVYDNATIDPENIPIEIINDDEHRIAVNARAAKRLMGLVLSQ